MIFNNIINGNLAVFAILGDSILSIIFNTFTMFTSELSSKLILDLESSKTIEILSVTLSIKSVPFLTLEFIKSTP